jgi:predicted O-linked N-acetylglucosamine transferase (SPINDLY family)
MSETDRGHALLHAGQAAEAAAVFRRVLEKHPNDAAALSGFGDAHFALFQTLWREGRFEEAERSFEHAASIRGTYVDARHRLGDQAFACNEFAMAARHYRAYAKQRPDTPNVWMNLGLSLARAGDPKAAQASLEQAVALAPAESRPLAMLAALLKSQGRTRDQVAVLERLAALLEQRDDRSHGCLDVRLDLARAFIALKQYREAKQHLARILQCDPSHLVARWLMFQHPDDIVAPDEAARESYLARWREGLAWFERLNPQDPHVATQANATLAGSTNFYLAYIGQPLVEEQRRNADVLRKLTLAACPGVQEIAPRAIGAKRRRVLVFSPSLQRHSVERVWGSAWLELDPAEFELSVMYPGAADNDMATRWRERGIRFATGQRPAESWIAEIQAFAPDIAIYVDIGMHQLVQALASLRLAPVQATTWAHPVTSGMRTIDYFLSADAFEPDDAESHYSERLVRLPRLGVFVQQPRWQAPSLERDAITRPRLLCSQHAAKLHPGHDALFARVLAQVPGAELDILCSSPPHVAQALATRLQAVFAQYHIDFAARCRVHPLIGKDDYLRLLARADVCLDSLDFSGCLTSLDALWCDQPIVTLPGALMRGRQTAGLLRLIGMDELIAASPDEYVHIATRLAQKPEQRAAIRARIAARKSELFEDRGAVAALAKFLRSAEPPST